MDIASILYRVIEVNEYVNLPGMGSLVRQYEPCNIKEKGHTIHPGQYRVIFDSQRDFDDNALVNYLRKYHDYDEYQAYSEIKKWCEDTLNTIKNGSSITIQGIGSLIWENECITLTQNEEKLEPWGKGILQPIHLPIKNPAHNQKKRKALPLILALVSIVVVGAVGYTLYQYPEFTKRIITRGKVLPSRNESPNTASKTSENNPSQDDTPKVDIPSQNTGDTMTAHTTQPTHEATIEAQTNQSNALQYVPVETSPGFKYHIIAGSFTERENAEKLQRELVNKGFKAEIISHDTMYRVSMGWYSNFERAQQEVDRLLELEDQTKLWIFKQRVD